MPPAVLAALLFFVGAASGALPTPTLPQLRWQQGEIMALIHFNMATFYQDGDPGCDAGNWPGPAGSSNPNSFAPTALNVSNWVDSMKALGAHEAVLTAKHGCGFYLWDTGVQLPDGSTYAYHVNVTRYGDVLQSFTDTLSRAGIGHGFYYSLTNNFYLNVQSHEVQPPSTLLPGQVAVTQAQFEQIALASVAELWTRFGNLTEIWFDGGYTSDMKANLTQLLLRAQPDAVAFGGAGISHNPVRWCGTEGGSVPGWPTIYSTSCDGDNGAGCPPNSTGAAWNPSGVDFTLQTGDHWFIRPGQPIHTLADLVGVYHNSVGANGVLELDFAIDRTGNVAPSHAARYAEFGAWIKKCYGSPIARVAPAAGAAVTLLPLGATPVTVDRVSLTEDQTYGQLVSAYAVEFTTGDGSWAPFSSGISIGNKRIDVRAAVNATALRLTVSATFDDAAHRMSSFSAFAPGPCALPSTRVKFRFSDGRCLVSNASFPCGGRQANSCPTFMGDCGDATAVWSDVDGYLVNAHWTEALGSEVGINIDCNSATPHSVAKLLNAPGSYNAIAFAASAQQLVYAPPGGASVLCLTAGQGPVAPPCDGSEPARPDEVTVDDCALPTTVGWQRIPA